MELSEDLCYVLGALRDGCLTSQYSIKFKQKNREWLSEIIIPKLNSEFGLNLDEGRIYEQNDVTTRYYIAFKSKRVHEILSSLLESSEGTVPDIFELMTKQQKIAFVRGFWDADGGCPRYPENSSKQYLNFTQKDPVVLQEIADFLSQEGISCGEIRSNEKKSSGDIHRFSIVAKQSVLDFIEKIGSEHPEKSERILLMKELISTR